MKRNFRKLLSALLSVVMVLAMVPFAFAAEGDVNLTILATSDLHGNIWGYSYEDMKESKADGMARISTYVNQVRAENPNTILVDNGDTIQGTILTDDLYSKGQDNHPVIAAMNYMKYDAWTLGNHEFNFGVDVLQKLIAQSNAAVLSANIKNADGSYLTGAGWTIIERSGVKVAVIGVTTPNVPRWDGSKNGIADLTFQSMADGVDQAIDEIGDQADVIMVCTHAGLEAEYSTDGADAAQTILDKNPEVDLLQLGHTHTSYINNDGPIPIGETKNNAAQVLRYDVTVNANKEITSATVQSVSMADYEPDQALRDEANVKAAQEAAISFIKDNVLGHAAANFQPVNEIAGIPAGRIMDTAVMDLIANVQLLNSGADVTGAALFKDTSDLKEGDLNYGNIFDIYKYPNVLYTVNINGAELKAYMEWAAECYNTWEEGDVNISFNYDKPGYLHDHFAGCTYEVNLSKPAGQRIENVVVKGQPLTDDMELVLCVNDYRFSGLKAAGIISGEKTWESSASVRDMLVAYLAEHDPLEPVVDNNWKITGVDLQLDSAERAEFIAKVNAGEVAAPYYKSYNLNDANNVLVDGLFSDADSVTVEGHTYFRLRDLAAAASFNVDWVDGSVVITKGEKYTGEALAAAAADAEIIAKTLTVMVDGAAVENIDAVNVNGNYYVCAESVAALLGATAATADGVLTITTK